MDRELHGLKVIVDESMGRDMLVVGSPPPRRENFSSDEDYDFACEAWARKSLGRIKNVG